MKYLLETRGMPANRLVVGLPLYGRKFETAKPYDVIPPVNPLDVCYVKVQRLFSQGGWRREWDDETKNPWLINTGIPEVIGYDDAQSLAIKTEWAMGKGFRGIFFWEITQDQLEDGTTPLQQAVHEAWSREVKP
jgi:chitinase